MGYTRGFRRLGWVIIVVGTIALSTLFVISEGLPTTAGIFLLLLLTALALTAVVQGGISILAWLIPWIIRGFKE